ncbi:MAG TPA: MBL fold metallo-hydrolase [Micropepsaceae bacterium]|nr:MBL fold metallo-hydrolase [Micropepsaceae bacterium]
MRKSIWAIALLLPLSMLALLSGAAQLRTASAQAAEGPQTGKLEQIIPGHYMYSSGARISGVIATSEGVVVLDALSSEAMAKHERQLIANTIQQPVRYLISSTFHGNYSLGNVAYQDVIRIGHENYKADLLDMMKEDKMPAAQQAAMLPHQTFRDRMTLYLGGKEIQILHIGRAHTRGDAIVFVPQDRIVYLSEVFFDGRFPFMNSGYIDWIHALDIALNLDADIFVPGQGPSSLASNPRASRQALIRARQVLVDFRDGVAEEIARGATEDQAVSRVQLPQYQGMVGYQQQREVLVRRTYQGLKGTLP